MEIQVTLTGRETIDACVNIDHDINTSVAYGLAFNDDGDVVAETDSTRYSGFCEAEIVYHELHRLIAWRWGIESGDIADALDMRGIMCDCEED
jgi:hypothetical protein